MLVLMLLLLLPAVNHGARETGGLRGERGVGALATRAHVRDHCGERTVQLWTAQCWFEPQNKQT